MLKLSDIDAVLNHKAGADATEVFKVKKVDSNDRRKVISDAYEIEDRCDPVTVLISQGWTKFDFKERGDKYSSFKWNFGAARSRATR